MAEQKDTLLKRVEISTILNEKLKKKAKEENMNNQDFITSAIEHYIDYLDGNVKEENIYTLRMNEIIQLLNLLRTENSMHNQSVKNRLDSIFEMYDASSYLNN
ncbi:hypothetical protein ACN0TX_12250 [Staphylococcus cohnii]|uniref:hypothetical protein n=1 Tax=Staphylococcus cohnii TaxID=29382 RepID=UPI003AF6C83D